MQLPRRKAGRLRKRRGMTDVIPRHSFSYTVKAVRLCGLETLGVSTLSGAAEIAVVESFEKNYQETVERVERIKAVALLGQ